MQMETVCMKYQNLFFYHARTHARTHTHCYDVNKTTREDLVQPAIPLWDGQDQATFCKFLKWL